jgi:hypothetical protein
MRVLTTLSFDTLRLLSMKVNEKMRYFHSFLGDLCLFCRFLAYFRGSWTAAGVNPSENAGSEEAGDRDESL